MELSKNYIPATVEEKWYQHWLSKDYFKSVPDDRQPFTIVIPPPNVTGVLHMGHTLNETVQDILVRKARMTGFNACWVPGSDHASIATEAKVVDMLRHEKGIGKSDISREEFLKYAYEWKEKYGSIIYNQIAKLGCSVDWNRVCFTMDDHYYKAVIKVFVDLYNKGLIYRGARMINWDPAAKTALSDEEVEYREVTGKLYYIKYLVSSEWSGGSGEQSTHHSPLITDSELSAGSGEQPTHHSPLTTDSELSVGSAEQSTHPSPLTMDSELSVGSGEQPIHHSPLTTDSELSVGSGEQPIHYSPLTTHNYIVIATQRPETIMGDVAVCANPNDERYTHLKGKKVIIPLINKEVPVIFDEYVDKDFGTGILKITPAHDINDFNIGLKYNLPVVDTLNEDGTISKAAQIYIGEDRFVARKKIVDELREKGLLIKEEEYTTRLGYSQRTNVVAEPKISTQWFVKMKELAGPALEAVTSGKVTIHPGEKFLATYKYWMENIKDWCISRQLWWGQQIPAWYDEEGRFVVAETEEQAKEIFNNQYSTINAQLKQDEDVLDTWCSSWIWPIEVFYGITKPGNADLNYYYPVAVLVTGQDIIFFWVARMIMAGMEYMHEKPFSDVYFTGMVRDTQGRKMSKSLGNSPDLLQLIHEYGADAVRFGIMISSPAGNDLLFDEASLEQGKHFNNKLWNALKLIKMWAGGRGELAVGSKQWAVGSGQWAGGSDHTTNNFAITWFENRLNEVRSEVDILMSQFRLSEALKTIYSLIWDDFCSWFLEWIKPEYGHPIDKEIYNAAVSFFEDIIQILHPFMPFITEEIYHLLKERDDDLVVKQFPASQQPNPEILQLGNKLKDLITSIRDTRNKNNIRQKDTIRLFIETESEGSYGSIKNILGKQANAENIEFITQPIASSVTIVVGKEKLYIETNLPVDVTAQKEKLLKDLDYLKGFLNTIDRKLSNDRFVQNAKAEVIGLERKKKADAEAKIRAIEQSISFLK